MASGGLIKADEASNNPAKGKHVVDYEWYLLYQQDVMLVDKT